MSDEMNLEHGLAPPMANGELLFEAPWQGRIFGMARVLCEQGHFPWTEFREALVDKIRGWDQTHREQDPYVYYDHFLAALTDLLSKKTLCDLPELLARDEQFRVRSRGHDH